MSLTYFVKGFGRLDQYFDTIVAVCLFCIFNVTVCLFWITSERIELESMLSTLNDRLNEPKTPTKFDGARPSISIRLSHFVFFAHTETLIS